MLFLFAQRSAFKNAVKITLLFSLAFSFFFNSTVVGQVAADYLNVIAPSSVLRNGQFEVSLDISTKPNTSYFLKGRIGSVSNQLTKGQTLASDTGIWLSDSVGWTSFPTFQTNSDGHWSGKLTLKASSNIGLGNNLLVIRIKNSLDNSLTDSSALAIAINEEPPPPPPITAVSVGEPILNEFMPNPASGSKEWVEIKNNGNSKADLSGWKVDDEPGKSLPDVLPTGTIISPGSFLVVTFPSPKLNDLADSVRLLKPDDSVVEIFSYNSTQKGKSYAKDSSGNWFVSDQPTPSSQNPNPTTLSLVQKNTSSTVKPSQPTPESSLQPNSQAETQLQVKGLATSSAKTATTASALNTKIKSNSFFSWPLIILGLLLTIMGIIFVVKRRSGRSTSKPPLRLDKSNS